MTETEPPPLLSPSSEAQPHDVMFDKIMESVGDDDIFQKKFNYIFNMGLVFFASMVYVNIILALNVPDHWCHVPGREFTNMSIEEWRNITLPIESDNKGSSRYSSCNMYNVSITAASSVQHWDYKYWNFSGHNVLDCVHGYEYDKLWYENTAVSQEDWVCKKDLYQTNAFVFSRIGEMIGTFFFGQLSDTLGRRVIYYISILLLLGGRILTIFTTSWYTAFAIVLVVGSLTASSIFQTPLIIAMETSKPENRAYIAMTQSLAWAGGMCVIPILYWYLRNWISLLLITTTPMAIFLFFPKYLIESPRWLASRGKFAKSVKLLNYIAVINKRKVIINENMLRKILDGNEEKLYGVASLFSSINLALNTILLVVCWTVVVLGYFVLILYIAQLPGNPFLNFFGQSIIEIPGFILGQYMCNRVGRRLTNAFSSFFAGILCIAAILIANYDEWFTTLICLTVAMKLCTTATFFTVNLQSMEIYPTCLRQTGISFGIVVSNVIGVFGPYIVYLGQRFDGRYPYIILLTMFVIGGVCGLFLSETLHQKLPDSLEEAKRFGVNQKFWSIPRPPRPENINELTNIETEELNQTQFSP